MPVLPGLQDVEDVCFGSGLGPSSKRANEVRTALLLAGFPNSVPAYTINRWACRVGCRTGATLGGKTAASGAGPRRDWLAGTPARACLIQAGALALQSFHCTLAWVHPCSIRPCRRCRQCAAGLQSIADVAANIAAGYISIGIAGGVVSPGVGP